MTAVTIETTRFLCPAPTRPTIKAAGIQMRAQRSTSRTNVESRFRAQATNPVNTTNAPSNLCRRVLFATAISPVGQVGGRVISVIHRIKWFAEQVRALFGHRHVVAVTQQIVGAEVGRKIRWRRDIERRAARIVANRSAACLLAI